ncbi:MAG TPA: aminopeptidase [Candidatus Binatia bacterium]|nr:aminopeptidase [Candidatus Binatia bacterium]
MRASVVVVAAALAAALSSGCGSTAYVARVGWAEAKVLLRREPIPELLARPSLDPGLRTRLGLVLAARDFARDTLGLAVGDSYASFATVDGDGQVWVLSAARRDRLEPYTWWYPIVGRVPYRGFFDAASARAAGAKLARRDLDVEVRTAAAFSTLGWFADPLLSSTVEEPPVSVVETVLHELFHATLYRPGETAFDESAATFVGHRGAIAFFCAGPAAEPTRCAEARRRWDATRERGHVLGRLATRLRRLYAAKPAPATRERARTWLAEAAAAELVRRQAGRPSDLLPPNNARLLGDLVYVTRLDAFERLAPTDGDVGPAVVALVDAVRGASEPFRAVEALASRAEAR